MLTPEEKIKLENITKEYIEKNVQQKPQLLYFYIELRKALFNRSDKVSK